MKKLLLILIPVAVCMTACVHEDSQTAMTASAGGGSFNPVLSADSARALSSGAAGPTGLTRNPDTIPQPFAIPTSLDTSQRKSLNATH